MAADSGEQPVADRALPWSVPRDHGRFRLVDALNTEWEALNGAGQVAAHHEEYVTRWSTQDPVLAGCRRPADVLATIRRHPDEVLGLLIGLRQRAGPSPAAAWYPPGGRDLAMPTAMEVAGRILLQTMLGKLVTMARRDRSADVEAYVGALWGGLDSYALTRRPRRIAANLALDTLKAVTRDRDRLQLVPVGSDLDCLAGRGAADRDAAPSVSAPRVLRRACELGLIDDPTHRLLFSVYAEGMSGRQAATAFGLTPTTVRYRCSRAVRRLAVHAPELLGA